MIAFCREIHRRDSPRAGRCMEHILSGNNPFSLPPREPSGGHAHSTRTAHVRKDSLYGSLSRGCEMRNKKEGPLSQREEVLQEFIVSGFCCCVGSSFWLLLPDVCQWSGPP